MNSQEVQVQNLKIDLRDIRQAIERAERLQNNSHGTLVGLRAQRSVLLLMLLADLILILVELFRHPSLTTSLYATHYVERFRYTGISIMFVFLLSLLGVLYGLIRNASRSSGETLEAHVLRNFSQLGYLSLISDLFTKFFALSLVILARRPDWVSPLLIIFTGDYLIQGRFFTLPYRLGMTLGVGYLILGTIVLFQFEGYLLYAFLAFFGACSAALIHNLLSTRHLQEPPKE